VTVELFGMGVASRHHGGALGDAQIGLPQPHAVLAGQPVQSLDRRVQQLGIGRERDGLGLHCGVDRDPLEITGPQCTAFVSNPQAFGQQQLQLVTQPLAPVAQIRALVRKLVLEELLPGEVLKIWIMDPALADALVGQPVDVFEQQQPDHEPGFNPRPALVAVERCDLAVDPLPVDLASELHQLVLHIDDLLEPRSEQIG
jgi:hypothetical protein